MLTVFHLLLFDSSQAPGILHVHDQGAEGPPDEPTMTKTFSKVGLQETWEFYQDTQGPKTVESLSEDEKQVASPHHFAHHE